MAPAMKEFAPFPKMARLNRSCTITEKIDGTNASIEIVPVGELPLTFDGNPNAVGCTVMIDGHAIFAGSRTRWVTPHDDNYGFAAWVLANRVDLMRLGPGRHNGEWWGGGINRAYGLPKSVRRFSLFNTQKWQNPFERPVCCDVVPILYEGLFSTVVAREVMAELERAGSRAVAGFMNPEGIVVYHHALNGCLKATIKGDDSGKSYENHPKRERPPKPPRDPSKGGRRKEQLPASVYGVDRRKRIVTAVQPAFEAGYGTQS